MPLFSLAGFKGPVFGQNKKAVFAAEKFLLMKNRFLRRVPGRILTAGLPLRRTILLLSGMFTDASKTLYFLTFFLFRVHSGSFHPACVLRRSRDQISRKSAESRKSVTVFFEYPPGLEISRCIQHLPYSARIGSKNKTVRKQPYHVRCSNIHVNRSSASAVPAARERNTSSNSGCV